MKCTDEQIASLLSDYFSGHLASEEEERVRTHIAICSECRDSFRTMALMTPQSNRALQSHPAKDVLGLYYHDRAQLSPLIAEMVGKHLSHCRECANELSILDDMERDLRHSVSGKSPSVGRVDRLVTRYGRYVAYALAACLVLLVGYRVTVKEDQTEPATVRYRLAESVRSGSTLSTVSRSANTEILIFEVGFYHVQNEHDYAAFVTDAQGETTIARASHIDFPEQGLLLIRLLSAALRDGEFRLVVRESTRGADSDSTQAYFPFRLTTTN